MPLFDIMLDKNEGVDKTVCWNSFRSAKKPITHMIKLPVYIPCLEGLTVCYRASTVKLGSLDSWPTTDRNDFFFFWLKDADRSSEQVKVKETSTIQLWAIKRSVLIQWDLAHVGNGTMSKVLIHLMRISFHVLCTDLLVRKVFELPSESNYNFPHLIDVESRFFHPVRSNNNYSVGVFASYEALNNIFCLSFAELNYDGG